MLLRVQSAHWHVSSSSSCLHLLRVRSSDCVMIPPAKMRLFAFFCQRGRAHSYGKCHCAKTTEVQKKNRRAVHQSLGQDFRIFGGGGKGKRRKMDRGREGRICTSFFFYNRCCIPFPSLFCQSRAVRFGRYKSATDYIFSALLLFFLLRTFGAITPSSSPLARERRRLRSSSTFSCSFFLAKS